MSYLYFLTIALIIPKTLGADAIYDGEECINCLYTLGKNVCRSTSNSMSYCCTDEQVYGSCQNNDTSVDQWGNTCTESYDADDTLCTDWDNDEFNSEEQCCACGGGTYTQVDWACGTSDLCSTDISASYWMGSVTCPHKKYRCGISSPELRLL